MELQLATVIQYKLLKFIGKTAILPLFMDNITTITTLLYSFKHTEKSMPTPTLGNELEKTDLSHKIITISEFIKQLSNEKYSATEIHIHLCGIYEVLDNIKIELQKVNEECEYMQTWNYFFTSWMYYSNVSVQKIKMLIYLLDSRYEMLLKMLMATK